MQAAPHGTIKQGSCHTFGSVQQIGPCGAVPAIPHWWKACDRSVSEIGRRLGEIETSPYSRAGTSQAVLAHAHRGMANVHKPWCVSA